MCWPFKKKPIEQVCNHKYKDFPWYIIYSYEKQWTGHDEYEAMYYFKVMTPYVCIKCKHRKEEQLYYFEAGSAERRDQRMQELVDRYPDKIKPAVEVEAMVKNEQLVDREYLELIDRFANPEDHFGGLNLFSKAFEKKKHMPESKTEPGLINTLGGC